MNLQYIQSELFRELVGIETLLEPECSLLIKKYISGNMNVSVWSGKKECFILGTNIITDSITTPTQITAEINRIWQQIPAECKKENILK